ncbi:hypothetical protein L207DRAFT_590987 [Hyaloscypha variabilis F]|uniref:Serine hydrolase domain-containing protein n=1 Tax=Hyaloscypha variabilis (strain UAMH 11265 / GT02V1 / F) TaxID=1149755 RepID=A0A2J6R0T0_HYAVF|nr:hypothetical protein L207DRAFT_590987 [Hyaloscypha variabilis F]
MASKSRAQKTFDFDPRIVDCWTCCRHHPRQLIHRASSFYDISAGQPFSYYSNYEFDLSAKLRYFTNTINYWQFALHHAFSTKTSTGDRINCQRALRLRQGKPSFRCAIFLSAGSPAVDFESLREGHNVVLPLAKMAEVIDMPTVHVWGKTDPYADAARELSMLCRSDTKSVFVHSGGHEVPGAGSKDAVTSIVNVIRRTTLLAQS